MPVRPGGCKPPGVPAPEYQGGFTGAEPRDPAGAFRLSPAGRILASLVGLAGGSEQLRDGKADAVVGIGVDEADRAAGIDQEHRGLG